jgi:hypothetical protein
VAHYPNAPPLRACGWAPQRSPLMVLMTRKALRSGVVAPDLGPVVGGRSWQPRAVRGGPPSAGAALAGIHSRRADHQRSRELRDGGGALLASQMVALRATASTRCNRNASVRQAAGRMRRRWRSSPIIATLRTRRRIRHAATRRRRSTRASRRRPGPSWRKLRQFRLSARCGVGLATAWPWSRSRDVGGPRGSRGLRAARPRGLEGRGQARSHRRPDRGRR